MFLGTSTGISSLRLSKFVEETFLNPGAKFCVVLPTFPLWHGLSALCVGVCHSDRSVFVVIGWDRCMTTVRPLVSLLAARWSCKVCTPSKPVKAQSAVLGQLVLV